MTRSDLPDLMKQMRRVFQSVFLIEFQDGRPRLCDENLTEEQKQFFRECNRHYKWKLVAPNQSIERIINHGDDMILVIDHYLEIDGETYVLELMLQDITHLILDRNALLRSIEQLNKKIYQDSLTGVYNRRYYDEYFADVYADAALAIMDVDNFKSFNDNYGHLVGDQVLRQIAQTIQRNVRPTDAVIRYGGDEFVLIFMDIPPEIFLRKLNAIRNAVANVKIKDAPDLSVTLSIGGCQFHGDIGDLLAEADRCLYRAKIQKNTIVLSESGEEAGS